MKFVCMTLAVPALALATPVLAQTVTDDMNVQIVIEDECMALVANDLDFGTHGVLDAAVDATTTLEFACTEDTAYNIGLDAGDAAGATVTARAMTSTAGDTVGYSLYQDGARSVNWGNTVDTDTFEGVGTGSQETVTVYGQVPAQATPPAGTYTDIVQVTLTY